MKQPDENGIVEIEASPHGPVPSGKAYQEYLALPGNHQTFEDGMPVLDTNRNYIPKKGHWERTKGKLTFVEAPPTSLGAQR